MDAPLGEAQREVALRGRLQVEEGQRLREHGEPNDASATQTPLPTFGPHHAVVEPPGQEYGHPLKSVFTPYIFQGSLTTESS